METGPKHDGAGQSGLDMFNSGLFALEAGLSVIPVGLDKVPLVPWAEYQKRLATGAEYEEWFARFPGTNLGIVTGELSGVDVIDFDVLGTEWPPPGKELPTRAVVRTPRGGLHYYVQHVPGARNSASVLAKGIDIRAEGGYVVCPPSRTPGGSYEFAVGDFSEMAELRKATETPEPWLSEALLSASQAKPAGRRPGQAVGIGKPGPQGADTLEQGHRNDALFRVALRLRHSGLSASEVGLALRALNAGRCKPPLPENEIEALLTSVLRYKPKASGLAPVPRDYPRGLARFGVRRLDAAFDFGASVGDGEPESVGRLARRD